MQPSTPAELVVDMGLTSGVKWAARDLDLTKPWRLLRHPVHLRQDSSRGATSTATTRRTTPLPVYNWGGVNAAEPWYDGQPYGNTKGNTLTGDIPVGEEFDAARANLGSPGVCRPRPEFAELFAGSIYIDATGTEIPACDNRQASDRERHCGPLPPEQDQRQPPLLCCSGYGNGSSWNSRGGYYWSARSLRSLGT